MKQRTVAVLVALLALMLSPDAVVMAKGMYVRDWITISVRSGPYDDAKIIGMANTNDYLEIVDERDQWSKVRIPAGKVFQYSHVHPPHEQGYRFHCSRRR